MRRSKTKRRGVTADDLIGARIRECRILAGLTQAELAKKLGIRPQHAHNYERSHTRISAGRLYEIAWALNVPIAYLYEGVGLDNPIREAPTGQRLLFDLTRSLAQISDERHLEVIRDIVRTLAGR